MESCYGQLGQTLGRIRGGKPYEQMVIDLAQDALLTVIKVSAPMLLMG